jgi:predicted enzyme related to lactoylglutathione lyase
MKRATAIGGIFFRSADTTATNAWYAKHLGVNLDAQYGTSFEWRHADDPQLRGFTAWSPFKADTDYFGDPNQQFMVNYRVADLEALIPVLKEEGVAVVKEIETLDYGKFAHVIDGDGRRVELWEAYDEPYGKMVEGQTTS